MDYVSLGRRIREERLKCNLTQEKLAEKINLSTAYIGQIERGERRVSVDTLVLISTHLNTSVDYLLVDSVQDNNYLMQGVWRQLMDGRTDREKNMALDTIKLIFSYMDERKG